MSKQNENLKYSVASSINQRNISILWLGWLIPPQLFILLCSPWRWHMAHWHSVRFQCASVAIALKLCPRHQTEWIHLSLERKKTPQYSHCASMTGGTAWEIFYIWKSFTKHFTSFRVYGTELRGIFSYFICFANQALFLIFTSMKWEVRMHTQPYLYIKIYIFFS